MALKIKVKRIAGVPTTSNLETGEIGLNTSNNQLYVNIGGTITSVSSSGGGGSVDLSAVDQDIIPDANNTRSLGSASKRWADLFLSGSTINLGGATISSPDGSKVRLPASSQVGTSNIAQSDSDTGIATRTVDFFTAAGGLSTAATTFTFAASSGVGAQVFTSFTKSDGSTAGKFELFTF